LDLKLWTGWSQRLTRSHHSNRPRFTSLTTRPQQRDHGV